MLISFHRFFPWGCASRQGASRFQGGEENRRPSARGLISPFMRFQTADGYFQKIARQGLIFNSGTQARGGHPVRSALIAEKKGRPYIGRSLLHP